MPTLTSLPWLAALLCGATATGATPPREDYLEVAGTRLYYQVLGTGEPLLLVHGGPVLDHSYFLPQMAELAKDHQLIFYDQRLCGKSDPEAPPDTVTLDGFVADIEALREALELESLHLVGHSFGGLLAMKYAIAYPERLDSLLLCNSVGPSSREWQSEQRLLAERLSADYQTTAQEIRESDDFKAGRPAGYARLLRHSFSPQFHDPVKLAELNLEVPADYPVRSQRFGAMAPDLARFDVKPQLDSVSCPVLILYGDQEVALQAYGGDMTRHFPDAELAVIEDCGHFPFIEQPEAFFARVREFLGGL